MSDARLERVRARLGDLDALIVSHLPNVRWLSGFSGSAGWLVVGRDRAEFLTDGRYDLAARAELDAAGTAAHVVSATTAAALLEALATACRPYAAVGFEAAHVTVEAHGRYEAALGRPLGAATGIVEGARRAKDSVEIAAIARAAQIADAALASVAGLLRPGVTEVEFRNALDATMRELGADGPSYDTIVAAGPVHAARPHHHVSHRPFALSDLVVIDVGALVDGYHSDMTRTAVVGEPNREQLECYGLVARAQLAGLRAVRSGVRAADVDAAARGVIDDAGWGRWFVHGTGHGVGLDIHEDPFLNATSSDTLMVGDVVTVEPGVYREGFGGVRIEDLIVVTDHGCRNLTATPKDAPCLPSPPTT